MKRFLALCALVVSALGVAVLPSSPVAATAPTVIDVVGAPGAFGANSAGFCAITQTGSNKELYCWGPNYSGKLGVGDTLGRSYPTKVLPNPASGFTNTNVTAVAIGAMAMCAIESGSVFCAGVNSSGTLGNGSTTDSNLMVKVANNNASTPAVTNNGFTAIAVGEEGTCVLDAGVVRCFGASNGGNVSGTNVNGPVWPPATIPDASPWANSSVSKIFAGAISSCALKSSALYCWGNDFSGSLGDGTGANAGRGAVKVANTNGFANTNVTKVAISAATACALEGGSLWCWGNWGSGLAGLVPNGASADVFSPEAAVWPTPPAVSSNPTTVSPTGGTITVTGSGFTGATAVTIGSTSASFSVSNDGSIDIVVPALSAGNYTITITTPGGSITQSLTIGAVATTTPATTAPATTAPATTVAPQPQFVTSAVQAQLEQTPGTFSIIQNGVSVTATLTKFNSDAGSAAATPPAARTAAQVAEIQSAAVAMLATFVASLPQGATSTVTVQNTTTGAVLRGLARDASGNAVDVPAEEVILLTTPSSALLLAGVNASNAVANISASGVLEIGPGGVINVAGSGLPGAGAAELVVMSTPRLLKSFVAGSDGTFADRAALPNDLPAGNHTVVLAGSGIYMAVGITVEATSLPTTGSNSGQPMVIAFFLLVFAALVIRSRRTITA